MPSVFLFVSMPFIEGNLLLSTSIISYITIVPVVEKILRSSLQTNLFASTR